MEKKPTSGLAVAGLVTGIIALVSSFVPLLNLLSFPFVILAIVFGGIGLWQVSKGAKGGKGLAVSGLVLGVLALVVTLAMYGTAGGNAADTTASGVSGGAGASEQAAEPQAADQSEPAASSYAVTIDGCRVTEDYEGNPAAVVAYTFTNNSDETTSAAVAVHAQAFQNGTELELAVVTDAEESGKSMNEVKPGSSITYELSYELADMSDLTVEVEELFSFSDELIAEQTFSLS